MGEKDFHEVNPKEYLKKITRYDFYHERSPKDVNPYVKEFVLLARNVIIKEKPEPINILVITPPTKWISKAKSLNFYTFATFEYSYEIIKVLSEILTPLYLEFEILPVIKLFEYRYAEYLGKFNKKEYRDVKKAGLLIYQSEE